MRIEVIAFTDAGEALAGRVRDALCAEHEVDVARSGRDGLTAAVFAQRHFARAQALVFVGAAGIAVGEENVVGKEGCLDGASDRRSTVDGVRESEAGGGYGLWVDAG